MVREREGKISLVITILLGIAAVTASVPTAAQVDGELTIDNDDSYPTLDTELEPGEERLFDIQFGYTLPEGQDATITLYFPSQGGAVGSTQVEGTGESEYTSIRTTQTVPDDPGGELYISADMGNESDIFGIDDETYDIATESTPTPEPDTDTPTPEPDTDTPTPEPDTDTPAPPGPDTLTPEPDTPTPEPDTPTPEPDTPTATPSQSCQAPEMEAVQLYTSDSTISQGSPGEISGSIATSITNNCPIKVQVILRVPSGVRISGSGDVESGSGGLLTSTFVIDPGQVKGISANVYGETVGEKVVRSSITYFPVGNPELAREQDTGELEFIVQSAQEDGTTRTQSTTSTVVETTRQDSDGDGVPDEEDYAPRDPDIQSESDIQSTPEPTSTPTSTPGFGLLTTFTAASLAMLLIRRL